MITTLAQKIDVILSLVVSVKNSLSLELISAKRLFVVLPDGKSKIMFLIVLMAILAPLTVAILFVVVFMRKKISQQSPLIINVKRLLVLLLVTGKLKTDLTVMMPMLAQKTAVTL